MTPIPLRLDLGDNPDEARQFSWDNPHLTLAQFLESYPARFPAGREPSAGDLARPVSHFVFQFVRLKAAAAGPPVSTGGPVGPLRAQLDACWAEELERQAREARRSAEPELYPEAISDNQAVRLAYRPELEAIAGYLRHGMSVLVVADKMLGEFVYEFVCHTAGKTVALDSGRPQAQAAGLAARLDQAVQGGPANPLEQLPAIIHNLKAGEVLVLRALDLLDNPAGVELLYQRTATGQKPQLLAFLDPSQEAKKVVTDRFAVHIPLIGLPRYTNLDGGPQVYTVTHLLTRTERDRFARYEPEGLYKHVAGLNALQFRHAMQYVGATLAAGSEPTDIYRQIRQFKKSSNDEIEIPDTAFKDIGGYEEVKQQLRRIIALIAGPIQGISEKQRSQLIPRGFIFHGPPGTGKTLFAKAIANEMNATIQMISGPEIMDKYVGQSESNLRRVFNTARRNAPAVIFFDEFDSLASQRSTYADGGARANNAVVAQLLTELDGFRQDQAVLVVGTTNRIDIIDEALIRPSRLRPIEIGLPDYPARQRVAEIHARRFGVDRLLKDLCALAASYLEQWLASAELEQARKIPQPFLDDLFAGHPAYRTRYQAEAQRAAFLRDVRQFFELMHTLQAQVGPASPAGLVAALTHRLQDMGQRYGLDLSSDRLPDLTAPENEPWLLPMQADLKDLFAMLGQEQQQGGLTPQTFLAAVLDLVTDYTDQFNNDEIRAVFQEASLEHHMEGQLVTPRYLGQKIGLIRKRRDERQAIHLDQRRARR